MPTIDAQITFCYTLDLTTTSRFYAQKLGLPLVLDQGGCRIYRTAPGAYLGFCDRDDAERPQGVVLTIVTEDVDGWYAHLSEMGVMFEQEPMHNDEYGIYHCFLSDPNGYMIEIQSFDDPNWSAK
jgi:catechol 2,3-dioxygenase-like lactoylglutathione lyase family enzyme